MLNLLGEDIYKYRDQTKIEKNIYFHDYFKRSKKRPKNGPRHKNFNLDRRPKVFIKIIIN